MRSTSSAIITPRSSECARLDVGSPCWLVKQAGPEAVSRPRRPPMRSASEQLPNLLWIQSERLELSAPFRRSIAESFDANAAGQPTFDRGHGPAGMGLAFDVGEAAS